MQARILISLLTALLVVPSSASGQEGGAGNVPVYVEDSPAAEELMAEALQRIEQDQVTEGVRRLQQIIRDYPKKLMEQGPGRYVDAHLAVRQRLVDDPALHEAYTALFESQARRQLRQATEPRPRIEALEEVVATYPLTNAGLEAGLLLAGLYLERAEPDSAASTLDSFADHPDRNEHEGRYHYLQAVTGLLGDDQPRLQEHRSALQQGDHQPNLDQLEQLAGAVDRPVAVKEAPRRLGEVGAPPEAETLASPLWRHQLSAADGGEGDESLQRRLEARQGESAPSALPVVAGDRIYLNGFGRVQALDRISGRVLWNHHAGEAWTDWDIGQRRRMSVMGRLLSSPRGVAVNSDTVFAVIGRVATDRESRDNAAPVLRAIHRRTGRRQWQLKAGDVAERLNGAHFYGTPLRDGQRLFLLARQQQAAAGIEDVFLVAVGASEGKARWHRHVMSIAMPGRRQSQPRVRMTRDGGRLYLSDPIGTAAAVETRTGTVRWVRMPEGAGKALEEDFRRQLRRRRNGLPRGRPVRVPSGLIVPRPMLDQPAVLLEPHSGRHQRDLNGEAWASRQRLIPVGEDVLAIADRELTLFDGRDLTPRWQHRLGSPVAGAEVSPAVTEQFLVIPTEQALVVLSRSDGQQLARQVVDATGHVMAQAGQILLASHERLSSFMEWRRARDGLQCQIEEMQGDPGPALSLASLALQTGHADQVLNAVDQALRILEEGEAAEREPHQRQLFRQLLRLTREAEPAGEELRHDLFDRVATIADTPTQQVIYHLTFGQFLESTADVEAAAEHYQTVLNQSALAERAYELEGVQRHAGREARVRLRHLLEEHGREVYERFDREAGRQLAMLGDTTDPDSLLEIARQYPFATAATEARLRAARRLIDDGRINEAVIQLRLAYQRAGDTDRREQIVGRLAALYEARGRADRARRWLRRVKRQYPELRPYHDGHPLAMERWLERLADASAPEASLPRISPALSHVETIDGTPLGRLGERAPEAPIRDRVLIRDGRTLRLLVGPAFDEKWTANLPEAEQWQLIRADDQQVLAWSSAGHLLALDGRTGERAWPVQRAPGLLALVGKPSPVDEAETQQEQQFLQMLNLGGLQRQRAEEARQEQGDYFAAVGPSVVTVVGRFGRAVGLAAHTGEVLWRAQLPVDRVEGVTAGESAVAIHGVDGVGTDARADRVVLLGAVTGDRLSAPLELDEQPQWLGFAGDRVVVAADAVYAFSLSDGHQLWRTSIEEGRLADRGWASQHVVTLLGAGGWLAALDPETGEQRGRFSFGRGRQLRAGRLVGDQTYLLTRDHVRAVNGQGAELWRDAVNLPEKVLQSQAVTERYVVLTAETTPEQDEEGPAAQAGRERHLFLVDRETGRLEREYRLSRALEGSIQRMVPIQQGLVVCTDARSLLLSGASD
jgi:outer membrane protein assembly factor BamB